MNVLTEQDLHHNIAHSGTIHDSSSLLNASHGGADAANIARRFRLG